jgi:hypothetical protein
MDIDTEETPQAYEQRTVHTDSQLDLLQQFHCRKGLARNTLTAYMSDLQHFGLLQHVEPRCSRVEP